MSAPAHITLSVQQFLTKNSMTPMAHPPYSPDLTPSDFFCFPTLKKVLKAKQIADVEEGKQKMAETVKDIKINKFKNCFEQWKKVSIGVVHQIESTLK